MVKVLLPTIPSDLHALAVEVALQRRGSEVIRWFGADYPSRQSQTLRFNGQGSLIWECDQGAGEFSSSGIDVVWNRRPARPVLSGHLLHPDDESLAETELNAFSEAAWYALSLSATWVNPDAPARASGYKAEQLRCAKALGMKTPDTLMTNDPTKVRSFIKNGATIKLYISHIIH